MYLARKDASGAICTCTATPRCRSGYWNMPSLSTIPSCGWPCPMRYHGWAVRGAQLTDQPGVGNQFASVGQVDVKTEGTVDLSIRIPERVPPTQV